MTGYLQHVLCLFSVFLLSCGQGPAPARPPAAGTLGSAQTLMHNARIYTVNVAQPRVDAMVFDAGGEIVAVGSGQDLASAFPHAERRDLGGRAVIPGLIDAHVHLDNLAQSLTRARLEGTRDKTEIIARLKDHESGLGPGDWLLGRGWDQNDWPVREFPTRQDLDEHFPDRPVWLRRIDGHANWANSAALAVADRDFSGEWQVEGGWIHRDPNGEPTGIFIDNATALIGQLVPAESESLLNEALEMALQMTASMGLTGMHQAGTDRPWIERFLRFVEENRFPSRLYIMANGTGDTLPWLCEAGGIEHPSGRLFARAAKLYIDGALGSRGAALLENYSDAPGNRGLLFTSEDDLASRAGSAMSCGFQVAIHAIGDDGNRTALNALQSALLAHPGNPGRHRVEHVQVLDGADLGRFVELGVIASMQTTHATSDMYWAEDRLGADRMRFSYAWRSLLDSGARLALGSDFPVEEVNPMLGIYAAVARQDLQGWPGDGWYRGEAMTRAEALRGFTLDAAYAGFMENLVGSLEVGKRADFLVLDRDIMTVPAAEIPGAVVLETWLDGQRVFSIAREGSE